MLRHSPLVKLSRVLLLLLLLLLIMTAYGFYRDGLGL